MKVSIIATQLCSRHTMDETEAEIFVIVFVVILRMSYSNMDLSGTQTSQNISVIDSLLV